MKTERFVDLWKRGFILVAPATWRKAAEEGASVIGTRHLVTLAEFTGEELVELKKKGELDVRDDQDFHRTLMEYLQRMGDTRKLKNPGAYAKERKEHPTLPAKVVRQIVKDHAKQGNPPQAKVLTVIGKECILLEMDAAQYEEPMGRVLGCDDGSIIIEGEFKAVPEGRLQAIEYIDIGKARNEGAPPSDIRPWRHEFSTEVVHIERVKDGLRISGPKRLWEVC